MLLGLTEQSQLQKSLQQQCIHPCDNAMWLCTDMRNYTIAHRTLLAKNALAGAKHLKHYTVVYVSIVWAPSQDRAQSWTACLSNDISLCIILFVMHCTICTVARSNCTHTCISMYIMLQYVYVNMCESTFVVDTIHNYHYQTAVIPCLPCLLQQSHATCTLIW